MNPPGDAAARSVASRIRRPGARGSDPRPLAPPGRSSCHGSGWRR